MSSYFDIALETNNLAYQEFSTKHMQATDYLSLSSIFKKKPEIFPLYLGYAFAHDSIHYKEKLYQYIKEEGYPPSVGWRYKIMRLGILERKNTLTLLDTQHISTPEDIALYKGVCQAAIKNGIHPLEVDAETGLTALGQHVQSTPWNHQSTSVSVLQFLHSLSHDSLAQASNKGETVLGLLLNGYSLSLTPRMALSAEKESLFIQTANYLLKHMSATLKQANIDNCHKLYTDNPEFFGQSYRLLMLNLEKNMLNEKLQKTISQRAQADAFKI